MSVEPADESGQKAGRDRKSGRRRSALSDYLRGAAHIFDFTGSLGTRSRAAQYDDPAEADAAALAAAWQAVGDDLYRAMGMRRVPPES